MVATVQFNLVGVLGKSFIKCVSTDLNIIV